MEAPSDTAPARRPKTTRPSRRAVIVHVPKCGGTSILAALLRTCGKRSVYQVYERPQFSPPQPELCKSHLIICGHMGETLRHYLGSRPWSGAIKVAVMREPVDRLISQYVLWRHGPANENASPLRKRVASGELDIVAFARLPGMNGLLHDRYFGDFEVSRFALIITNDHFASGVDRLSELLKLPPLDVTPRNVSATSVPNFAEAKGAILDNTRTMDKLNILLAKDITFYRYCTILPSAAAGRYSHPQLTG